MKKLFTSLFLTILLPFISKASTYTVGLGGNYSNLQSAFAAVNSGVISGYITFQLISSTVEPSTVILDGGSPNATYNTITIYPTQSGLTIEGNIQLNACDSVYIDGRVNQSGNNKDLTIQGTNLTAIRFMDAQRCAVKYCNLKGGQAVVDLNASLYWLPVTGSSYNNISYNNISYHAKNPSHDALLRSGTTWDLENVGDTISHNNFFNFITTIGATTKSRAIAIRNYSRGMYIENNSIYDDASIVNPFGANTWAYGIDINCILPGNATPQTLTAYTSFPHHIIGNYIGSTQPLAAGNNISIVNQGSDVVIKCIAAQLSALLPIIIQNNLISGFSINAPNGLNGDVPFVGIYATGGKPVLNANTIGSDISSSKILLTSSGTSDNYGIAVDAVDSVAITNNIIGGISLNSQYNPQTFTAIKKKFNGRATITGNLIGSNTIGNSIYDFGSSPLASYIVGISVQDISTTTASTNCIVSNNTISNLHQNTASNTLGVAGIVIENNAQMTNAILENNIIRNLTTLGLGFESAAGIKVFGSNTSMNLAINYNTISHVTNMQSSPNFQDVFGIEVLNSIPVKMNNNYVSSIRSNSNNGAASHGIYVTGNSEFRNNIVFMDTTLNTAYAIRTSTEPCKLIHNTLVIHGGQSDVLSTVFSGKSSDTLYNNIIANYKSNTSGTQPNHRCMNYGAKNAESNFNHFFISSPGLGGVYVVDQVTSFTIVNGQLVATTTYTPITNFTTFQTWSGGNANSIGGLSPSFVNPNNGLASGFYPNNPYPTSNAILSNDYFNANRTNAWAGAIESSGPGSPLPLSWLSFNAIDEKYHVVLDWETNHEENTSHFEIQRSTNAKDFITIGEVAANNQKTNTPYRYFDDNTQLLSEIYYRIKQLDLDGKSSYSTIQKVKRQELDDLSFFPNPTSSYLNIRLANNETMAVTIYSVTGQRMIQTSIQGSSAIDVSILPAGTYHIQCSSLTKKLTASFTKQ